MPDTAMAEIRVPDDQLARRAQLGDQESLRTLIRRLYPGVYAFVFRMLHHEEDARDVTQDVFLRMTAHLHEYRGEYKFTTWLFRIAINRARDILRTRGRRMADIAEVPETAALLSGPEGLLSYDEDRDRVLDAVRRLPESVRECLLLAYQVGLPHAEIAGMLGITPNAVKLRVHKALQLLRTQLKRSEPR
jgi:RNA polymerase sigma-70 factor (ECF subfamily)